MFQVDRGLYNLLMEIREANKRRCPNEEMHEYTLLVPAQMVGQPGRVCFIEGKVAASFFTKKRNSKKNTTTKG